MSQPTASTPSRKRHLGVAAVIVAAAITLAAALVGKRILQPAPPGPPRVTPLTSLAGMEGDPALSPDGNQVAFLRDGGREGDPPQLYVRMVDGGNMLEVDVPASHLRGRFQPAILARWPPRCVRTSAARQRDRRHLPH